MVFVASRVHLTPVVVRKHNKDILIVNKLQLMEEEEHNKMEV